MICRFEELRSRYVFSSVDCEPAIDCNLDLLDSVLLVGYLKTTFDGYSP